MSGIKTNIQINNGLLWSLLKLSHDRDVSLNTLINEILKTYLNEEVERKNNPAQFESYSANEAGSANHSPSEGENHE